MSHTGFVFVERLRGFTNKCQLAIKTFFTKDLILATIVKPNELTQYKNKDEGRMSREIRPLVWCLFTFPPKIVE